MKAADLTTSVTALTAAVNKMLTDNKHNVTTSDPTVAASTAVEV
jgi:hypothetical protein